MNLPGNEIEKVSGELIKDVTQPTAKSIGNNLGLMAEGIMGWLGLWGEKQKIKQEQSLNKAKKVMVSKIERIPEENLKEPKISVVGPILDNFKYYYDETLYQEMFTSLLAAACNKELSELIHPAFSDFIKQITPLEAKILSMFNNKQTFPKGELRSTDSEGKVTPYNVVAIDFGNWKYEFDWQEKLDFKRAIENLERLGLILDQTEILELNYDYDDFLYYDIIKNTIEAYPGEYFTIVSSRLILTRQGEDFLKVCS